MDEELDGPSQAADVPCEVASPGTCAHGPTAGDSELDHLPSSRARTSSKDFSVAPVVRYGLRPTQMTATHAGFVSAFSCLNIQVEVSVLQPPETFGELALLDPTAKRMATVYCTSPDQAWVVKIGRTCFDQSVKQLVQVRFSRRLSQDATMRSCAFVILHGTESWTDT